MAGHDIGLTHMAFVIADRPKNIGFYPHGTGMQIIHQREPAIAAAEKVAWLSGLTRSCALAWCRRAPGKICRWGHLAILALPVPAVKSWLTTRRWRGKKGVAACTATVSTAGRLWRISCRSVRQYA